MWYFSPSRVTRVCHGPGMAAISTGTFTTLAFVASESMWNSGDGYYIRGYNSVSLLSSAGDRNNGCGVNDYDALFEALGVQPPLAR